MNSPPIFPRSTITTFTARLNEADAARVLLRRYGFLDCSDSQAWQEYLGRSKAYIVPTEAICWEWLNAMSDAAKHRKIESPTVLAKASDELLVQTVSGCAFGLTKRISAAVGSEELRETYKKVLLREPDDKLSVRFIDPGIKLGHFMAFPSDEFAVVYRRTEKNGFCYQLLRDLVLNHILSRGLTRETLRQIKKPLSIEVVGYTEDGAYLLE